MPTIDTKDNSIRGGFGPAIPAPAPPSPAPVADGKFIRNPDGTLGTNIPKPPAQPSKLQGMWGRDQAPKPLAKWTGPQADAWRESLDEAGLPMLAGFAPGFIPPAGMNDEFTDWLASTGTPPPKDGDEGDYGRYLFDSTAGAYVPRAQWKPIGERAEQQDAKNRRVTQVVEALRDLTVANPPLQFEVELDPKEMARVNEDGACSYDWPEIERQAQLWGGGNRSINSAIARLLMGALAMKGTACAAYVEPTRADTEGGATD